MMLVALTSVIVTSYAVLVGGALWRDHGRTVTQAERNALNTAKLLADLLAATVADIDRKMSELGVVALDGRHLTLLSAPLTSIAVVDAKGRLLAGSADLAATISATATGTDAPAPLALFLAAPGAATLVFRRPMPGRDGDSVIAGVPAPALTHLFARLDLDPGSSITVRLADGTPVVRADHAMGTPDGGRLLEVSAAVGNAPLAVTLAISRETVLAGWRETALNAAVAGAVLAVVLPALLMVLLFWMRRVQAAEEARRAAEAANRAKSDFLALMSHELRTPLNTVLGFAEMIRDRAWGPQAEDRYVEYAADIHTAGTHLLSLVNDVLDLAKIEAGRKTLYPEAIDPHGLADACMRLTAGHARTSGVSLTTEVVSGSGRLFGDPRALRQIVVNLLSNACKYTPCGGSVHLSIADRPDGGGVIRVSDTGVGMTPDDITKALEWFSQADHRMTDSRMGTGHMGTGLGLPLTKGLVELHGGTLSIDSAPGQGTTVTLTLPGSP